MPLFILLWQEKCARPSCANLLFLCALTFVLKDRSTSASLCIISRVVLYSSSFCCLCPFFALQTALIHLNNSTMEAFVYPENNSRSHEREKVYSPVRSKLKNLGKESIGGKETRTSRQTRESQRKQRELHTALDCFEPDLFPSFACFPIMMETCCCLEHWEFGHVRYRHCFVARCKMRGRISFSPSSSASFRASLKSDSRLLLHFGVYGMSVRRPPHAMLLLLLHKTSKKVVIRVKHEMRAEFLPCSSNELRWKCSIMKIRAAAAMIRICLSFLWGVSKKHLPMKSVWCPFKAAENSRLLQTHLSTPHCCLQAKSSFFFCPCYTWRGFVGVGARFMFHANDCSLVLELPLTWPPPPRGNW